MVQKRVYVLLASAALAATMVLAVLALPAQAALRHLDGTVVGKDDTTHSFRLKTQSGNRVRIRVNGDTVFQRISGFKGIRAGMAIEVDAASTGKGLLAKHVEPREGSGGGGRGGGGADDGPNHA